MIFTPEQPAKAKAAKSAEELLALAKENGMEMTEEESAKYFTEWHKEGELSDDELSRVSAAGEETLSSENNVKEEDKAKVALMCHPTTTFA